MTRKLAYGCLLVAIAATIACTRKTVSALDASPNAGTPQYAAAAPPEPQPLPESGPPSTELETETSDTPIPVLPAAPAPPPSKTAAAEPRATAFQVPAGFYLRIRTGSSLSTRTMKTGSHFEGWLSEPVTVGGATVLPRGARVEGLVTSASPGGRIRGRAALSLRLIAIELRGRMMPLHTSVFTRVARSTKSRDVLKIGGGAGPGAAIGAIAGGGIGAAFGALAGAGAGTGYVLATHGAAAVIPSESLLAFQLRAPLNIEL